MSVKKNYLNMKLHQLMKVLKVEKKKRKKLLLLQQKQNHKM
jgi:hypothetical protein